MDNHLTRMRGACEGRPRSCRAPSLAAPLALAVTLALGAAATARAQAGPIHYRSSAVGVADGQYARLNAYFVTGEGGRPELPPGPCRLTLRFLDQTGTSVAESVVTLVPSRDTFLDYRPAGLRPGERAMVRAEVIGERDPSGIAPRLMPSVEVVDADTGRTGVANPGAVRALGPPEPATSFSTFGMASMQVARVSAAYVGLPSDTGLPPGPCNVTLTLYSGNGSVLATKEVTVTPGETVSLDFPAGFMVPGVRRRLWARAAQDGRAQGFLAAAVEIFDAPTGKGSVLHPGSLVQSWGWE